MRSSLVAVVAMVVVLGAVAPAAAQNLLTNPGFEDGTATGWFPFGGGQVDASTLDAHTGAFSGLSSGRTATWNGPAQDLLGVMQPGKSYSVSGWVRLRGTSSARVQLTIRKVEGSADYSLVAATNATDGAWSLLTGTYTLAAGANPTELLLYFEGPASGVEYFVDDAVVEELGDWRDEANERIEQLRKRDVEILVVDALGQGIAGVGVDVEQTRRRFAFGSAISRTAIFNATYRNFFIDHFEWATFENEAKWYSTEPQRDSENYFDADWLADFCRDNGIRIHGHTLFWAVPGNQPSWVAGVPDSELQAEMEERLTSIIPRFRDDFLHWDVNNEMLHGSYYVSRLGPSIRPWMFERARQLDPDALLFVNDYNIISGNETDAYIDQIRDLQSQGIVIDAVGVQGHFSGTLDPWAIKSKLDRLGALGLPIWVTEFDIVDANDLSRADKLEILYRTAFSHPSVDGILMWGFWAGNHWRGEDAAIVDLDWTLNAAGARYEALLAEWTTAASGNTAGDGRFALRAFHGDHAVTLDDGTPSPPVYELEVEPGFGVREVVLPLDPASCLVAGEVIGLTLTHEPTGDVTTLAWLPPVDPAGMAVVYDVLRAASPDDFASARCLETDDGKDTTALDGDTPASGSAAWFLVRARNVCPSAEGTLGGDSTGTPRTGAACPE